MTIDELIGQLQKAKERVGGDKEIVTMGSFAENDYIEMDYVVTGDLTDQDGNDFACAIIGEMGGSELTVRGTPHYKWKPYENRI